MTTSADLGFPRFLNRFRRLRKNLRHRERGGQTRAASHPSALTIAFLWLSMGVGVALCGCPAAEQKPGVSAPPKQPVAAAEPADRSQAQSKDVETPVKPRPTTDSAEAPSKEPLSERAPVEEIEAESQKPRDLGPPLVDDVARLRRLAPDQPVWVDPVQKHVVLQGEVCQAGYPLEFFATYSNRAYEAVVSVNVQPSIVHAGLLAVGAVPGHPARFQPEFEPPTGTEIAIEVRWKDEKGKVQSAPAQQWIRNIKTRKPLEMNWVFAGSMFVKDEATGKEYYQADSGELICVLSLPTAMLDLPIRSYGALEARSFEAFEENLPPAGTPVTIVLKPILTPQGAPATPAAPPGPQNLSTTQQQAAIETAGAWLSWVDRGEYSQSWDMAAPFLKKGVERRDFVKSLTDARKPFGKVLSRQLESQTFTARLPKAPEGRYLVLQYKVSFENGKSAIETVTPMLDGDNVWRVAGYYIK